MFCAGEEWSNSFILSLSHFVTTYRFWAIAFTVPKNTVTSNSWHKFLLYCSMCYPCCKIFPLSIWFCRQCYAIYWLLAKMYECGLLSATYLTTLKFQSTFNGLKRIQLLVTCTVLNSDWDYHVRMSLKAGCH